MSPGPDTPISTPQRKKLHNRPPFSDITPLRPRLTSVRQAYGAKRTQAIVKPIIRNDFMGNLQKHVDVYEFVESVWGLKRDTLDWQRWGSQFVRPENLYKEFFESSSEPLMYKPLCAILENADEQARTALKIGTPSAIKLVPMGSTRITNEETVRSPDWIACSADSSHLGSNGEMVRASTVGLPICNENKVKSGLGDKARADVAPSSKSRKARKTPANPTSKRSARANVQDGAIADDSGASTGMKRKTKSEPLGPRKALKMLQSPLDAISDICTADAEVKFDAFGPDAPKLTQDEVQLASYALESMSDIGNRRYTTGIFMRGKFMSLWYFDRIGAIKTEEFDIQSEADQEKLVLVAHALHCCDRDHFGYEPLLRDPTPCVAPTSVVDAILTLPDGKVQDSNGDALAGDLSFKVTGKALHVQYGIVGRGTVVLPVVPQDVEKFGDDELVAKLSWPVATRPAEDTLLRTILEKVPKKWQRHLPDLFFSATFDADALSLPRSSLKSKSKESQLPEQRVLRILVCGHVYHLSELRSLEYFKSIFLDFVRCHRVVYETAGVLHRDLSVNNLMFRLHPKYKVCGLLNDWDLSETVSNETPHLRNTGATARHRTGTAPFMALDLLLDNPPRHLYRHDLESFVYVLVWCAVQFSLDPADNSVLSPVLCPWAQGSWQQIHSQKSSFISTSQKPIFDAIQPAFKPILDTWIKPLVALLRDAYAAQSNHYDAISRTPAAVNQQPVANTAQNPRFRSRVRMPKHSKFNKETDDDDEDDRPGEKQTVVVTDTPDSVVQERPWDDETCGGRITYEKVMAILERNA
ncbi:hypothetical protein EWM64_g5894 [Hericium alpestre]|uniref:Fungal-type protein kinase domain-containing protein n=1 Tax=Hericium alpestre TaxID=135208 RepID=A0A4Y9ZVM5_9AGAM|nr:hypothetical protein EWM64_g5894 [Hericium alpestre]